MGRCGPLGGKNCGVYPENVRTVYKTEIKEKLVPVFAPNPNPAHFEVLEAEQVGRHVVAKIRYPDCINFEGEKICLYLATTMDALARAKRLDPHFTDEVKLGSLSPFARFKPTKDGWNIAVKVAENIF